jgi:transposase
MNRRQTIPRELRYTFQQFDQDFPTDDACLEQIKEQRWPQGKTECVKCLKSRKHYRVHGRTAYACETCGNHIYPLAGTIFEKTSTPLRIWFHAMYLMGSTRCGISAKQIQRETGVTYKTAWRMFHQIRKLMGDIEVILGGQNSGGVEVDEAYFGGRRKSESGRMLRGNQGRFTKVLAAVERKGQIVAQVTPTLSMSAANDIVREFVLPKSTIFTDDASVFEAYERLKGYGYEHKRVNHSQKIYVAGDVHTNTIEGFWSLVKRGIGGVYHSVSAKYLQGYLDEYAFRYNRRACGNLIFPMLLQRASEMKFHKPASEVSGSPTL